MTDLCEHIEALRREYEAEVQRVADLIEAQRPASEDDEDESPWEMVEALLDTRWTKTPYRGVLLALAPDAEDLCDPWGNVDMLGDYLSGIPAHSVCVELDRRGVIHYEESATWAYSVAREDSYA